MKRRAFIAALTMTAAGAAAQVTYVSGSGVLGFRRNGVRGITGSSGSATAPYDGLPAIDDFETYTVGTDLNALNGGTNWTAAYASRTALFITSDDFESYAAGADLDALNGGINWTAAYASRTALFITSDDFESYTATDPLDGLNAGINWNAAYASRP